MRVNPTINKYQEKLVIALAHRRSLKPATLIKEGISKLFDSLDERDREVLLKHYENMTPEERKNPDK